MWLISDVRSVFNDIGLYGRSGEKVTIISDHGNVVIVEGETGKRFSTKKENISNQFIQHKKSDECQQTKEKTKTRTWKSSQGKTNLQQPLW